jgi:hypothetical protein
MSQKYASYLDNVFDAFPALKEVRKIDSSLFEKMELKELLNKGYMNFIASRKELYRLSVLIEKYAVEKQVPLVASFEEEGKFKYAKDRYLKIMRKIPYTWVIGNFNNPFLSQHFPENAETISCNGTNLGVVWVVITKGPAGPMGLVAEELADDKFKGFFSISPGIVIESINQINRTLKVELDVTKKFDLDKIRKS